MKVTVCFDGPAVSEVNSGRNFGDAEGSYELLVGHLALACASVDGTAGRQQ